MKASLLPRLWPSAFYLVYFLGFAALGPFEALYFQQRGLSGDQIGLLMGFIPLVMLLASPFWTGVADATRRHKTVLLGALLTVAVLSASIPAIRPLGWLFAVVGLFAFFAAPIMPLADSATLSMLGGDSVRYGRIRIWGTLGWGLAGPFVGALLQRWGLAWAFWIYAATLCLLLVPGSQLVFRQAQAGTPFLQGARRLLADRRWLFFLFLVVVGGIGFSASNNYLAMLMDSLGGSQTLTGVAMTVSILSELPMMFFSYLLLNRLKSRGLFILAVAVSAARCLLYAVIGTPTGLIAVQVVHGLASPALMVAGVNYAAENAPPGLEATAQGVFSGVLMGVGGILGNLLGGMLIERFGPAGMFGMLGTVMFVILGIFLLAERKVFPRPAAQPAP
jgi:MFS transporter, PPP family, 3-phenylpropionic acid transporter